MTVATKDPAVAGATTTAIQPTANDRFKQKFGDWFWGSVIVATVVHFVAFIFWPSMMTADTSFGDDPLPVVNLPPNVEIPPPPEQIARPATPVVATAEIDQDITIAETTFDDNPIEELPPPPTTGNTGGRLGDFVPVSVAPTMLNTEEVQRTLRREYPPLLRNAGVEGQVVLYLWIETDGTVAQAKVMKSSGYPTMDQAALEVADIMRFRPAMTRDRQVGVFVQMPIQFKITS